MSSVTETLTAALSDSSPLPVVIASGQVIHTVEDSWIEVGLLGDVASIRCPQQVAGAALSTGDTVVCVKVAPAHWVVIGKLDFITNENSPVELGTRPVSPTETPIPGGATSLPPPTDDGVFVLGSSITDIAGFTIRWFTTQEMTRQLIPLRTSAPSNPAVGDLYIHTP